MHRFYEIYYVPLKYPDQVSPRSYCHRWFSGFSCTCENRSRCINSTNANHSQRQSNAITAFCSIYCQLKPAVLRRLISKLKLQFLRSKPDRPVQRALIRLPIQFAICADTNWKYCIFRLNWNCVSICENERMAQMNDHRIFKMGLVRNIKITIFTVTSIHFSTQQLNAIDMTSKQIGCDLFWARYFQCLMILLIFYRKIWTKISMMPTPEKNEYQTQIVILRFRLLLE